MFAYQTFTLVTALEFSLTVILHSLLGINCLGGGFTSRIQHDCHPTCIEEVLGGGWGWEGLHIRATEVEFSMTVILHSVLSKHSGKGG